MSQIRETAANFSGSRVYVSHDAADLASVRQCLDGDGAGFGPIVERYQRVLFTVALRMLGDRDEANDAAQSAFIKAYQKLATFDPQRRFFSWIYRILVNECLNQRREHRPFEPVSPELAAEGSSPADQFEAEERRKRVQAAIVALPIEYREVVVLRHFAELSYDEISETLGVSAAIVKSRLHIARRRLSHMLLGLDARR